MQEKSGCRLIGLVIIDYYVMKMFGDVGRGAILFCLCRLTYIELLGIMPCSSRYI